jgi:tRNA(fMet)-specific endonuclease VapC
LTHFQRYRLGEIGVCSVVAAELACGVTKSQSTRNRAALEMFMAPPEILPFDEKAIWVYGQLRTDLERQGLSIGVLDTGMCQ